MPPADYPSFRELPGFLRRWEAIGLGDVELAALQVMLGSNPLAGTVVPGAGSLRKVRFVPPGWKAGKSGAVRVYYANLPGYGTILLGSAYSKGQKGDLSPAERAVLAELVRWFEGQLPLSEGITHG